MSRPLSRRDAGDGVEPGDELLRVDRLNTIGATRDAVTIIQPHLSGIASK